MAVDSVRGKLRFRFIARHLWELFSSLARFLHSLGRQFADATRGFFAFFSTKRGELCGKHSIHPVVHLRVHLCESRNSPNEKNFNAQRCEFWARAKHRSGLERPHFFLACAPKNGFGVVPAHTCARKVCTMQMSAISIP
jgi:hypothetical protein